MRILALDATFAHASVALWSDNAVQSIQVSKLNKQSAQDFMPILSLVLSRCDCNFNDLEGIAFGCGPGSFTGTRVTAALAQGLSFGLDIPVVPISSLRALACLALGAHKHPTPRDRVGSVKTALVCTDARLNEVSFASYQFHDNTLLALQKDTKEELLSLAMASSQIKKTLASVDDYVTIGDGWDLMALKNHKDKSRYQAIAPLAECIAWLAALLPIALWSTPEKAQPVYLRGSNAWRTTAERISTISGHNKRHA